MVSTNETYPNPPQQFDASTYDSSYGGGGQRPRYDSNQLLMLPAPLGRSSGAATSMSPSTTLYSPPSEEGYTSDVGSQQRLVHTPSSSHQDGYGYQDEYESSPPPMPPPHQANHQLDARVSRTGGVLRQSTVGQYQVETSPYGYPQAVAPVYDHPPQGYTAEPEEYTNYSSPPQQAAAIPHSRSRSRGVSLADNGPVPTAEGGVRRVSRQGRRASAQVPAPQQNRYSRSTPSPYGGLPPGAAPPQPGYGY